MRDANWLTGRPFGVGLACFTPDVRRAFDRAIRSGADCLRVPETMPGGQTVAHVRGHDDTLSCVYTSPNLPGQ
jgi:hypothetical protein